MSARSSSFFYRILLLTGFLGLSMGWKADARTPAEVVERARTKVVVLKVTRSSSRTSGTGFLAAPGLVVTAAHTVAESTSTTAWLNGTAIPARVVRRHPELDLALLRLEQRDLQVKPLELGEPRAMLAPGEPVVILAGPAQGPRAKGDPDDRVAIPGRFRRAVQLRTSTDALRPALALDAEVLKGDSGSPVLRVSDGRVMGVLIYRQAAGEDGISRVAYAAPIDALRSWLSGAPPDDRFYLLPR